MQLCNLQRVRYVRLVGVGVGLALEPEEIEVTKIEMAEYLASTEPSVLMGLQTEDYWVKRYMRETKVTLTDLVDARTAPQAVK